MQSALGSHVCVRSAHSSTSVSHVSPTQPVAQAPGAVVDILAARRELVFTTEPGRGWGAEGVGANRLAVPSRARHGVLAGLLALALEGTRRVFAFRRHTLEVLTLARDLVDHEVARVVTSLRHGRHGTRVLERQGVLEAFVDVRLARLACPPERARAF